MTGNRLLVDKKFAKIKPLTLLLLVLEVWDVKPTYRKSMAWEFFGVVRFELGSLFQGQMRIGKCQSA